MAPNRVGGAAALPGRDWSGATLPGVHHRQTLIFDADDTLWDNNVYFERVVEDYLDWLAHPTLDRTQVRRVIDDVERANVVTHGYGSRAFLANLAEAFQILNERPATAAERARIDELAADLIGHRVVLYPDVFATLRALGQRHELRLLTKGDPDEQHGKIEASGLAPLFASVQVVPEKDKDAYLRLLDRYGLDPRSSWMIGNSPKSDILPARAAGLSAVYIPNASTWVLENADLDPDDSRVLTLRSFTHLLLHF